MALTSLKIIRACPSMQCFTLGRNLKHSCVLELLEQDCNFWQHFFLCGKEDGLNVPKWTRIHQEFLAAVDNTSLSYSASGAKDIVNPWSSIFTFSHIEMGCLLLILSLKADLVFHCPHQWNHFLFPPHEKVMIPFAAQWQFALTMNRAPTTPTTTIVRRTSYSE